MLKTIAEDMWAIEDVVRMPLGLRMPSRSTVVRLSNGKLVVHAPLAIDDRLAREIDALGEVTHLVAPSCLHHLFLRGASERWPRARVLGAPGLESKLGGLRFEPLPAHGAIDAVAGELDVVRIAGAPAVSEHVFLHARSRTLLVTDLVFNVHRDTSFGMSLVLRMVGAWKKLAQSRSWRLFVKDRALAADAMQRVLAWDFDRLVMAHGDVVERGAHAELAAAAAWLRTSARAELPARAPS